MASDDAIDSHHVSTDFPIEKDMDKDEAYCWLVFGDDWQKCVSPLGRRTLAERIENGRIRIERQKVSDE